MGSEIKIENGSLWRLKNIPDGQVCEVLFADAHLVALRAVDDPGTGWARTRKSFLDLYKPVPPSPPKVESRWAAVRPDGSIGAIWMNRANAVKDAKGWWGAAGVVRLDPNMDTWEAVS